MKRPYLYVEARGWFDEVLASDHALARPLSVLSDDPISFDSVQVEAVNDAEAEILGAAAMDTKHITTDDAVVKSHCTGRFLNFAVVPLCGS